MSALRTTLAAVFLTIVSLTPMRADVIHSFQEFHFVGECLDCTVIGLADLVLMDYNPGDPLVLENFFSFSYVSDLTVYSLMGTGSEEWQIDGISGIIPALLPSAADFTLTTLGQILAFQSSSGGSWCAGINGCNLDFGINGVWDEGLILPETGTFFLISAGLGGLLLLRPLLRYIPLVRFRDTFGKTDTRLPAEGVDAGDVERLPGSAVRT